MFLLSWGAGLGGGVFKHTFLKCLIFNCFSFLLSSFFFFFLFVLMWSSSHCGFCVYFLFVWRERGSIGLSCIRVCLGQFFQIAAGSVFMSLSALTIEANTLNYA